LAGGAFPLGQGLTSQVIRSRQPVVIGRWSEAGLPVQLQYATSHSGLPESAVTVPIIGPASDQVLGIIAVQSYAPNAYGSSHVEVLQELAAAAAQVIEAWRRRERALSETTRRSAELEAILAGMTEGLIITDAAGGIVRLNAAARALLVPLSQRIVWGQPLDHERLGEWPLRERHIGAALAELTGVLRRGEARRDVELDVWQDGHRTISLSASPLQGGSGEPAGGVIVIRDVTEQRALDRIKARVLQIASHDLQAPLTVVRGRAQYLARRLSQCPSDVEWLREGLSAIVAQADRGTDMLRLLLDVSLVEGGRIDLRINSTDLVALVREVAEETGFLSEAHPICVDAPLKIQGEWDAARLRQVLQNLIRNAIKYSPGGGRVDVRVRVAKGKVRVSVRDHGIGLRPEETSRVFDQFYRAAAARRLEGSGLGLYICQAIVAAHGGHISAKSPGPGKGTTFTFVMPLKQRLTPPGGS
jgi:two-component system phosphate regulon sensor histidine kinase PhoR